MDAYTLVPASFFVEEDSYRLLSQVVQIGESDSVRHIELPEYGAVLVYACPCPEVDRTPLIYEMIKMLTRIGEHNKVVFRIEDGAVHIAMAEGDRLLLANSYPADDFVTAEYFIFAALKEFQVNPEVTVVYFAGNIEYEQRAALFRYFKGVESVSVLKESLS